MLLSSKLLARSSPPELPYRKATFQITDIKITTQPYNHQRHVTSNSSMRQQHFLLTFFTVMNNLKTCNNWFNYLTKPERKTRQTLSRLPPHGYAPQSFLELEKTLKSSESKKWKSLPTWRKVQESDRYQMHPASTSDNPLSSEKTCKSDQNKKKRSIDRSREQSSKRNRKPH
jgi:hypothetical protein